MKIQVVKFENGKFAIRKTSGFIKKSYEYLSFRDESASRWWSLDEYVDKYCLGEEKEVRDYFAELRTDIGKPA